MASILKVDTITGVTTAGSISVTGEGNSTTTNLQQGLAKAWVNFNGTGTIATRDSLNTSSITDAGTGIYQNAYTNSMDTAGSYIAGEAGGYNQGSGTAGVIDSYPINSSSMGANHQNHSSTTLDILHGMAFVLGDLA
jgi:hypothetical protein